MTRPAVQLAQGIAAVVNVEFRAGPPDGAPYATYTLDAWMLDNVLQVKRLPDYRENTWRDLPQLTEGEGLHIFYKLLAYASLHWYGSPWHQALERVAVGDQVAELLVTLVLDEWDMGDHDNVWSTYRAKKSERPSELLQLAEAIFLTQAEEGGDGVPVADEAEAQDGCSS